MWVAVGVAFIAGGFIGMLIQDCIHMSFTNNAWKAVKYLADQNVELVKELKEKHDWTDEGEDWKSR
jgi:hypothetical protein